MPEAHEHVTTPLSRDELSLIEAIRRAQSRWILANAELSDAIADRAAMRLEATRGAS